MSVAIAIAIAFVALAPGCASSEGSSAADPGADESIVPSAPTSVAPTPSTSEEQTEEPVASPTGEAESGVSPLTSFEFDAREVAVVDFDRERIVSFSAGIVGPASRDLFWHVVGSIDRNGVSEPAIWTAPQADPFSWSSTTIDVPLEGRLASVVRSQGSVWAVGSVGNGEHERPLVVEGPSTWVALDLDWGEDGIRVSELWPVPTGFFAAGSERSRSGGEDLALWHLDARTRDVVKVELPEAIDPATSRVTGIVYDGETTWMSIVSLDGTKLVTTMLQRVTPFPAWALADTADVFVGDEDVVVEDLVVFNDIVFAYGRTEQNGASSPVVWAISVSGTWVEVVSDITLSPGRATTAGIGFSGVRVDAAATLMTASTTSDWQADVLASRDGVTWEPVGRVASGREGDIEIVGVAASEGTLVVPRSFTAPLVSANGEGWVEVADDDMFPLSERFLNAFRLTAEAEQGAVVVGNSFEVATNVPTARIWQLEEGMAESTAWESPSSFESNALRAIAGAGGVYVAGLGASVEQTNSSVVVWAQDAQGWDRLVEFGDGDIEALAMRDAGFVDEERLVLVGSRIEPGASKGAPWVGEVGPDGTARQFAAPVDDESSLLAVLCPGHGRIVATEVFGASPDFSIVEVDFEQQRFVPIDATLSAAGSARRARRCIPVDAGWILVGSVLAADGKRDGALWLGDDQDWQQVETAPSMGGPATQSLSDIVALGQTLIVAGLDERLHDGAVLWVRWDGEWKQFENPTGAASPEDVRIFDLELDGDTLLVLGAESSAPRLWSIDVTALAG